MSVITLAYIDAKNKLTRPILDHLQPADSDQSFVSSSPRSAGTCSRTYQYVCHFVNLNSYYCMLIHSYIETCLPSII